MRHGCICARMRTEQCWLELWFSETENLKHSNTFLIDAPQALESSRACVRSIPSNQVLACNTDVYLLRFSLRKSSIEPSFSSYEDLEETLIKYQRRSWPLFDFHQANKTFYGLLELPILFRQMTIGL